MRLNKNAYIEVEEQDEYRKWAKEIPFIKFKQNWHVAVIPPYGGAIVRFLVSFGNKKASVYLDCYDRLGYYENPYWEVYPVGDDVGRCEMNDSDSLLRLISESLSDDSVSS